jgi:hypothetical protein
MATLLVVLPLICHEHPSIPNMNAATILEAAVAGSISIKETEPRIGWLLQGVARATFPVACGHPLSVWGNSDYISFQGTVEKIQNDAYQQQMVVE